MTFAFLVCHSGWESEEFWTKRVQREYKENFGVPDDFFEGAEKLLEVCWVPGPGGNLHCLSREMIEEILQLARWSPVNTLYFYACLSVGVKSSQQPPTHP